MADNHLRSLAKAISWRIIGTMITSLLVFLFTGKWLLSLAVGGIEFLVKIGAFYIHERIWLSIKWGGKKMNDPQKITLPNIVGEKQPRRKK